MKKTILSAFTILGLNAAIAQTNGTDNNYNNNGTTTPGTPAVSGTSTVTPRNSTKDNGTYNSDGSYNSSSTNNSNRRYNSGDTTSTKMGSKNSTKKSTGTKSTGTYTHTPSTNK